MSSCPFCHPDIRKAVFAESESFYALQNIAPILPGHVLIIPKEHYHGLMETPDELLPEMVLFSKQVIKCLEEVYRCHSFDWTIQEGKAAGQTVNHFHMHIIPRRIDDLAAPGLWFKKLEQSKYEDVDSADRPKLTDDQMHNEVVKLKLAFNSMN